MELHLDVTECLHWAGEGKVEGRYQGAITGVATLARARPGQLSFLGNSRYRSEVAPSAASLIFLPLDFEGSPRERQIYFRCENPSLALANVCAAIERQQGFRHEPGIHPTAFVDREAVVADSATVGPFCSIGPGSIVGNHTVLAAHVAVGERARIGSHCVLMPQVTVAPGCTLGDRVRLHSGVVVGSDGFGYESDGSVLRKVPQIGVVVIGDDVEIGANTTIDRARFAETRIGAGTKIDNLVQIGHNVEIGENCIIVAQVGISGSTIIGDNVVVGGQSGVAGHLRIGSGCKIGALSGVSKDLPENSFVRGVPATDYHAAHKALALQRRLPDLFERVRDLEKRLAEEPQPTEGETIT